MQATNNKLQKRALLIVRHATGLDQDAARTLLAIAGGEVKTAYEYSRPALVAAVRVMFGEKQAKGKLPVRIPGL